MRGVFSFGSGLGLALVFLGGCASKQTVSLECVPREVTVYVDGRALEGRPEKVSVTRHEPHTFFFKGGGYNTQMVVLETREVDGESTLSPADVCKDVVFAEMQPEVRVEVEDTDPGSSR